MGQEQSATKSLDKQGTSSLTLSVSNTTSQSSKQERLETDEHQDQSEEGIITVTTSNMSFEEEEELVLLKSIPKFEPFMKEHEKGLSIDQMLGLRSKTTSAASSLHEEEVDANDPVLSIFFGLQSFVKDRMHHINLEQRSLLKRIAYVDELSGLAAQSMASALNQVKLKSGKTSEVHASKLQMTEIQDKAAHIFKELSTIEERLDPADKMSLDAKAARWPELTQFHVDVSKPAIERYISSSSDLAIVGTTSVPSMLDQMLQENDNQDDLERHAVDERKTSNTVESNSAPVSLALDRLRGLSSHSFVTEEDNK